MLNICVGQLGAVIEIDTLPASAEIELPRLTHSVTSCVVAGDVLESRTTKCKCVSISSWVKLTSESTKTFT